MAVTNKKGNFVVSLKREKYLLKIKKPDFNEKEIQNEINKTDDGRTLYLSLQLLKLLNTKSNTVNISQVCYKRIFLLSDKINIDPKLLNTFIKEWLTSKI